MGNEAKNFITVTTIKELSKELGKSAKTISNMVAKLFASEDVLRAGGLGRGNPQILLNEKQADAVRQSFRPAPAERADTSREPFPGAVYEERFDRLEKMVEKMAEALLASNQPKAAEELSGRNAFMTEWPLKRIIVYPTYITAETLFRMAKKYNNGLLLKVSRTIPPSFVIHAGRQKNYKCLKLRDVKQAMGASYPRVFMEEPVPSELTYRQVARYFGFSEKAVLAARAICAAGSLLPSVKKTYSSIKVWQGTAFDAFSLNSIKVLEGEMMAKVDVDISSFYKGEEQGESNGK